MQKRLQPLRDQIRERGNERETGTVRLKRDGIRAETRFRLSPKRMGPFKLAGASVQSTAGSRGVRISGSNAGYTTFRGTVRVLATHSIRQFPFHFPSRASPCAIRFQTYSNFAEQKIRYSFQCLLELQGILIIIRKSFANVVANRQWLLLRYCLSCHINDARIRSIGQD